MRFTHRRRLHSVLSSPGGRRRRGRLVAAAAGLLVSLIGAASVGAAGPAQATGWYSGASLKVMTRNLYLGADLTPAIAAQDPTSFLTAVAQIYGTSRFTNFEARAAGIADEIKKNDPDLVALQEASIWEVSGPAAQPMTEDFLSILQSALAARGLRYSVASVANNAVIGPIPLVQPCADPTPGACLVTLKDRDVVLVNKDTWGLSTWGAASGTYAAQQLFQPPVPGAAPVSFSRGWATLEGRIGYERFRFANTHLEVETFPAVQEAQTAEFLAGPARSSYPTIIAGDFNSAADGSTTNSYAQLASKFRDAWSTRTSAGLTCCQNETLTNPTSQLTTRIDLLMGRNGAWPLSAGVVGATPFRSAPPLYASDHAGVVATFYVNS